MWKKIKKFFESENSISFLLEEENKFIQENKQKAVNNLIAKGWNVLSVDRRVVSYGYKIQKNNQIYEVSLKEALNIK